MLSMRIDTLVAAMVRKLLIEDGGDGPDKALHIHFDLSMSQYYVGPNSYNQRCGLHLLYHCPYGGSVTVFSAVTESPFTKIKEVKEWVHEVTHDSCWRDIQVFSRIYFGMAEKINSALKADGFDAVAPKDMSEHNTFGLFIPIFNWVPIKVTKDSEDTFGYRRLVELV